jgi:plasmid stabilization system protein ParE
VRVLFWTEAARADHASVIIARIIAATERLAPFPESGRTVPEFEDPLVREVVLAPYRIVYRLMGTDEVHVLKARSPQYSRDLLVGHRRLPREARHEGDERESSRFFGAIIQSWSIRHCRRRRRSTCIL